MRHESEAPRATSEKVVKDICRVTRRRFAAEDKIRIVLDGLRGENSIAELCRREGINQNLYYRRSKEFLYRGHTMSTYHEQAKACVAPLKDS